MPTKTFSSSRMPKIIQPNLLEVQLQSYKWFLEKGLREVFDEISPISDHAGNELDIHFLDFYFDEPKYTEAEARYKDQTFEAPLRIKMKLVNKEDKTEKEQEVYLGDFPLMTNRGTFIINGVERVVLTQLIRSPGIYLTGNFSRGKKLFGAKVIPSRGAWLELETEADGFIGVKIDRKRKAPVTDILRIFGFTDNEEIKSAFAGVDGGEIKCLDVTLKKDAAKNTEESFVEIYKRLRPGDLATPDNAESLIKPMFFRSDRYDLSEVGRFKMNQRLNLPSNKKGHLLDKEDLTAIIGEIIRMNNDPSAEPDDIDHLGNRRVRPVGELVQNRFRLGLSRLKRVVQDRMSTLDRKTLLPVQLINSKILTSVVKEFFASSQLSQFMDQVNPLSELEHKRRISTLGPGGLTRDRAGFEVRDVHPSYYGRICPLKTPEGTNIGLVNYLSNFARVNELGFIITPYFKVENGAVTSKTEWLDAIEEEKYKIAQADVPVGGDKKIAGKRVSVRFKGHPSTCSPEEVDFIDVSANQMVSVASSLIPFLEHDDANRVLMGSNMMCQAVPSVRPQAPLVGTGVEKKAAFDSGHMVVAEDDGEVEKADATQVSVRTAKGVKIYDLIKFKRSNQNTIISQKPVVSKGRKVKKGDILADGTSIDDGRLALGQNLLAAFISWEGANFEDAIVLSQRVVDEDRFTSIHIEDFSCDVRDTKLGPEVTTPDIPNVSEDKLSNLDEEGVIRIGAEVQPGDILVGKISPKGESELTSEERLLRAIFGEKARDVKDTSLYLPHGKQGRIVAIKVFSRERGDKLEPGIIKRIQVQAAQLRKVRAGDKLAGRHGNKGVISQIRPVEDMPYLEDGRAVDIVLNPLGVASRMNIGQILETHLGLAASKMGYYAETPIFVGCSEDEIKKELKQAGFSETGKMTLFDGRTGQPFDKPITVGYIYMMKLNHLVEDKIHMRSTGPYSLITQQPLGGKAQLGGQRFGEMEVWALEGYGAKHTLQEMLTIKSDDVTGRSASFESIIRGDEIKKPNIPASFNVLVSELKSLGLNVEIERRE